MRCCSRSSWAVRSDSKVAATERMAVSRSVRVVSAPPRRSATSAQTNTAPIAQRGPDAFTAHASRDVIEGEGRKQHKRRYKDGRDDVNVARGLACTARAFILCHLGQRGGNNAKAKRRDQASVHSKTHGGRNTARQHDRFVEKPVHTGIVREAARGGGAACATVTFLPCGKSGASAGHAAKPRTRDKAHWRAPAAPAMMQSYRAAINGRAAS